MGDISAEPSMEEILSSIKRIIAEEESGTPPRPRRSQRPSPRALDDEADEDEILELSDPMPAPAKPEPVPQRPVFAKVTPEPRAPAPAAATADPDPDPDGVDPIVSTKAATATRGSLDALTRMVVKPEPGSDGTLEGLVRDLLRPMLAEWLDSHLPDMVEAMVAKEIARISSQQR